MPWRPTPTHCGMCSFVFCFRSAFLSFFLFSSSFFLFWFHYCISLPTLNESEREKIIILNRCVRWRARRTCLVVVFRYLETIDTTVERIRISLSLFLLTLWMLMRFLTCYTAGLNQFTLSTGLKTRDFNIILFCFPRREFRHSFSNVCWVTHLLLFGF